MGFQWFYLDTSVLKKRGSLKCQKDKFASVEELIFGRVSFLILHVVYLQWTIKYKKFLTGRGRKFRTCAYNFFDRRVYLAGWKRWKRYFFPPIITPPKEKKLLYHQPLNTQNQGHHKLTPEPIEFPLSKNQTKWPIEL